MSANKVPTVCVMGGGAAGFMGAITCAELNPNIKVIILEQSASVLQKVKISGGGRCNVTNACFDPKELIQFYPRGSKELLGPFFKFQPGDTMEWFENRGVELKIEEDGRVFPVSDSSTNIVDCLIHTAKANQVQIWNHTKVLKISQNHEQQWILETTQKKKIIADAVLVSTGGSPAAWEMLSQFHTIIDPVPSLFTFNIQHAILHDLKGISLNPVKIKIQGQKIETEGSLLITHWGLSGPAVLKMSAWGARLFHAANYRFTIIVNWSGCSENEVENKILKIIAQHPKGLVYNYCIPEIPMRLWKNLMNYLKIDSQTIWSEISSDIIRKIISIICHCNFKVNGKSTFKDEFVTAGGVALEEVDFRTMESKKIKNVHFAGEVLDIDALTGGYNFQAAWTTGFLAGKAIAEKF